MRMFLKLQAIRAVKAGGQADGLLHAGDIVTHINGTDVQHMVMADIVGLIAAAELLVLVVGRRLSEPLEQRVPLSLSGTGDDTTTSNSKGNSPITVVLDRANLGVTFEENPTQPEAGCVIKHVAVGVQAAGKLHAGDVLTAINGTDVRTMTMQNIVMLLEATPQVSLTATPAGRAGTGSSVESSHTSDALCAPAGGWNPSIRFGFPPDAGELFCSRRNDCA
jgi:C-terminal processing protease CtpA/Prc